MKSVLNIVASIVQSVISVIYTDRDSTSLVAVNLGHFHSDRSRFQQFGTFFLGHQDLNFCHQIYVMMPTNVTFHPHESEQIILKMKKQIDQLIMDKIEIAPKCADWESLLLGESSATTNTVFPSAVPFTDNELGFVSPISRSFIRTVQHFITTLEKKQ